MAQLAEVGLVLPFFEFLDIQCAKNNIHNIRVCRALVATGAVATEDLHRMDVAQKVRAPARRPSPPRQRCVLERLCAACTRDIHPHSLPKVLFHTQMPTTHCAQVSTVLEYAHEHNIEAFLEPAAELCVTLLQRDRREAAAREPGAGTTWHLVRNVQSFVVFCAAGAAPIARAAASCVVLLSEVRRFARCAAGANRRVRASGGVPCGARRCACLPCARCAAADAVDASQLDTVLAHRCAVDALQLDLRSHATQMYPAEAANTLLSDDGIAALLLTVSGDAAESAEAAALPAETLEALLTMLVNCGTKGRSTAGPDTIVELHSMVLSLKACPHAGVAQLADQVRRPAQMG